MTSFEEELKIFNEVTENHKFVDNFFNLIKR